MDRERSEYRRHADWVRATDDAKVSLRIRINAIRHLNFNDLSLVRPDQMTPEERKNKIGLVDGAATVRPIAAITQRFFDAFLRAGTFLSMADLEKIYPQVQAVLWKGLPYAPRQDAGQSKDRE